MGDGPECPEIREPTHVVLLSCPVTAKYQMEACIRNCRCIKDLFAMKPDMTHIVTVLIYNVLQAFA